MTKNKNRKGQSPSAAQVKAIREAVQSSMGLGITDAQDWCAEALHTSRRSFQQWETGPTAMHQAFWELLSLKLCVLHVNRKLPVNNELRIPKQN